MLDATKLLRLNLPLRTLFVKMIISIKKAVKTSLPIRAALLQQQVPLPLPCYDFILVISPAVEKTAPQEWLDKGLTTG
jgi:hypothetical protein